MIAKDVLAPKVYVMLVADNKQLCQVSGRAQQMPNPTIVRRSDKLAGHIATQSRAITPGVRELAPPRLPPQGHHPVAATLPPLCSRAAPSSHFCFSPHQDKVRPFCWRHSALHHSTFHGQPSIQA